MQKNPNVVKNLATKKNPSFCSNQADIQGTLPTQEFIILTKNHHFRTKIVEFLLRVQVWTSSDFFASASIFNGYEKSAIEKHFLYSFKDFICLINMKKINYENGTPPGVKEYRL